MDAKSQQSFIIAQYLPTLCQKHCAQCPFPEERNYFSLHKPELTDLINEFLKEIGHFSQNHDLTLQIAGYGELLIPINKDLLEQVTNVVKEYKINLQIFTNESRIENTIGIELEKTGSYLQEHKKKLEIIFKWWGPSEIQEELTGSIVHFVEKDGTQIPESLVDCLITGKIKVSTDCLIQTGNIKHIPKMYEWSVEHEDIIGFKYQLPNACVNVETALSKDEIEGLYDQLTSIHYKKNNKQLLRTVPYIGKPCDKIGNIINAQIKNKDDAFVYAIYPCHYWEKSKSEPMTIFPGTSIESVFNSPLMKKLREFREKKYLWYCGSASNFYGNIEQPGFFVRGENNKFVFHKKDKTYE